MGNHPTVRFRWLIVAVAVVGAVLAGGIGADVQDSLSSGGFEDPTAESAVARDVLAERFDEAGTDLVLLVTADEGTVDDPAVARAGAGLTQQLASAEGVEEAVSYWQLGSPPPLASYDRTQALVFARLAGNDSQMLDTATVLREEFTGDRGPVSVAVGGASGVFSEVTETIEADLIRAEAIVFPVTFLLLMVVFGSVVAALLPLLIGGFAILGTFLVLELVAARTEVSIFALNFTTAIGLGLAIDYALLVVSRFREELTDGHETAAAVRRTVRTAGRTVVFSGLTVMSALTALLVFEQSALRSFAYAGLAVVGLAITGAVVVLPAVLALLGRNVDRLQVRRPKVRGEGEGIWHRVATTVMRRPIPIATTAIVVLLVLGTPFLRIELGFPDDRVLPPAAETRVVGDALRANFASSESQPINVIAQDIGDPRQRTEDVAAYAQQLSAVEGVGRVDALTGSYIAGRQVAPASPANARFAGTDATYLSAVPSVEPVSPAGEEVVRDVRALDAPFDDVLVGGASAELLDGKSGILDRLPLGLGLLALITFVVLFLTFGSLLVPLKAIVLNLLSLTATFGALVWIFQDGHLAGVLNFTPTETITITMPVLMFIIAFGLSMDYEVFLLSRIKEEWDLSGDNEQSVAVGLERTGRIVTAAALLIAIVFAAFATGRVSFMKLMGIGMALAVLVDAFVVRTALVPAFMRLAGRANWWAPPVLERLHARIGINESGRAAPDDDDERLVEATREAGA